MFETYQELVCDYFFSNKEIKSYRKSERMTLELAKDLLTTHGVGGKFTEILIRYKFNLKEEPNIHGWDGYKRNRPVEIKTETINGSKKLNCEASFADHRTKTQRKKELFLNNSPLLYSVGVNSDGKCLYVMETDIAKVNKDSILFQRLDAKSPRINFSHWKDDTKSYKILHMNKEHILLNSVKFNKALYNCLATLASV